MSDYSNSYNGAGKDAGNDVIYGADLDTQFDNIATASSTKANKKVPASTNNVASLSASGDLQDAGYKFTNLSGSCTSTAAELNILDGVTALTADINVLIGANAGGVTSSDIVDLANRKPHVKDWGSVAVDTAIDLSDAELHIIECTASLTLTFSATNTNDYAQVAISTTGAITVTPAGIDNNSPTLSTGAGTQDIIDLVKSHGKITLTNSSINNTAV